MKNLNHPAALKCLPNNILFSTLFPFSPLFPLSHPCAGQFVVLKHLPKVSLSLYKVDAKSNPDFHARYVERILFKRTDRHNLSWNAKLRLKTPSPHTTHTKNHSHPIISGFDVGDGQLLFHTSYEEYQKLIESKVFQIIAYAAININETLQGAALEDINDIPPELRKYLEVKIQIQKKQVWRSSDIRCVLTICLRTSIWIVLQMA